MLTGFLALFEGQTMPELKELFEKASLEVKTLPSKPDNDTLLKLYALYKQGAEGDVSGKRPGGFDFVGNAKFDAWAELKGTDLVAAQRQYVDLVNRLLGR
jgi:acyl-CoA-binding protein